MAADAARAVQRGSAARAVGRGLVPISRLGDARICAIGPAACGARSSVRRRWTMPMPTRCAPTSAIAAMGGEATAGRAGDGKACYAGSCGSRRHTLDAAAVGSALSARPRGPDAAAKRAGRLAPIRAARHRYGGPAGARRRRAGASGGVGRQHRRLVAGGAYRRAGNVPGHGAGGRLARASADVSCARMGAPLPDLLPARRPLLGRVRKRARSTRRRPTCLQQKLGGS